MAIKPRRSGNKNPPILSHEFVIQNHADIVACIAMVFVIGLIFQVSSVIIFLFSIILVRGVDMSKKDSERNLANKTVMD